MNPRKMFAILIIIIYATIAAPSVFSDNFTSSFPDLTQCKFSSIGNNPYFPGQPTRQRLRLQRAAPHLGFVTPASQPAYGTNIIQPIG